MAMAWRSAAAICKSSICARPPSIFKTLARRPILSAARPIPCPASRHASVLASVESMLPRHSTVAIARLKSNIASDSSFWSWLSQGDTAGCFDFYFSNNLVVFGLNCDLIEKIIFFCFLLVSNTISLQNYFNLSGCYQIRNVFMYLLHLKIWL